MGSGMNPTRPVASGLCSCDGVLAVWETVRVEKRRDPEAELLKSFFFGPLLTSAVLFVASGLSYWPIWLLGPILWVACFGVTAITGRYR